MMIASSLIYNHIHYYYQNEIELNQLKQDISKLIQDNKQLQDNISDLKKDHLLEKQALEKLIQQQKEVSISRKTLHIDTEITENEHFLLYTCSMIQTPTPRVSLNTINSSFNMNGNFSTPGPKLKTEYEEIFLVIHNFYGLNQSNLIVKEKSF